MCGTPPSVAHGRPFSSTLIAHDLGRDRAQRETVGRTARADSQSPVRVRVAIFGKEGRAVGGVRVWWDARGRASGGFPSGTRPGRPAGGFCGLDSPTRRRCVGSVERPENTRSPSPLDDRQNPTGQSARHRSGVVMASSSAPPGTPPAYFSFPTYGAKNVSWDVRNHGTDEHTPTEQKIHRTWCH